MNEGIRWISSPKSWKWKCSGFEGSYNRVFGGCRNGDNWRGRGAVENIFGWHKEEKVNEKWRITRNREKDKGHGGV